MRVTRKALETKIAQQAAQLAASNHQTRSSLNRHVQDLKVRNLDLVETVKKLEERLLTK